MKDIIVYVNVWASKQISRSLSKDIRNCALACTWVLTCRRLLVAQLALGARPDPLLLSPSRSELGRKGRNARALWVASFALIGCARAQKASGIFICAQLSTVRRLFLKADWSSPVANISAPISTLQWRLKQDPDQTREHESSH